MGCACNGVNSANPHLEARKLAQFFTDRDCSGAVGVRTVVPARGVLVSHIVEVVVRSIKSSQRVKNDVISPGCNASRVGSVNRVSKIFCLKRSNVEVISV